MPDAAELAQSHWNETPLFLTEEERYSTYPWLYEVAEFRKHRGKKSSKSDAEREAIYCNSQNMVPLLPG